VIGKHRALHLKWEEGSTSDVSQRRERRVYSIGERGSTISESVKIGQGKGLWNGKGQSPHTIAGHWERKHDGEYMDIQGGMECILSENL